MCVCVLCVLVSAPFAHTNTRVRVLRSNPVVVSCVNKANKECRRLEREQWVTLLSDVPLCCCCLSLQVVSYHACVCGLFLIPYLFYTLSFSTPSECRVRAVVCVWLSVCLFIYLFYFSLLPTFSILCWYTCRSAHPTGLHLGRRKHAAAQEGLICLLKNKQIKKKNNFQLCLPSTEQTVLLSRPPKMTQHFPGMKLCLLESKCNSGLATLLFRAAALCRGRLVVARLPLGSEELIKVQGWCLSKNTPRWLQQGLFLIVKAKKNCQQNSLAVREVRPRRCSLDSVPICVFSAWCRPQVEFRLWAASLVRNLHSVSESLTTH